MIVGFLFGAGISLASGAPSAGKLTELVLEGAHAHRHSDGTYFYSDLDHPGLGDSAGIERIRDLLQFLKHHANNFFGRMKSRDRSPNYEDVYYLVTQLADAVDEYENPAISELLAEVEERFVVPLLPRSSSFLSADLLEEARHYIRGIVAQSLSTLQPSDRYLGSIVELAASSSVSRLDIFTLNHDVLTERRLESGAVEFSTGFSSVSKDLQCWDHSGFARVRAKVRVLKLHGSVDWYPVRFFSGGPTHVCVALNGDVMHAQGPNNAPVHVLHERPEILIGTFNKMLEYSRGIYADLFCAFRAAIRKLNALVISGYSFGDKGINGTLSEWTRASPRHRLLIVSPDAYSLAQTARGAIRKLLADSESQITLLNRPFEAVTADDLSTWAGIER